MGVGWGKSITVRILLSNKCTFCMYCQVRIIGPFIIQSAFMFCQAGMRLISKDSVSFVPTKKFSFRFVCRALANRYVFTCVFFPHKCQWEPIYNFSQTRISEQIWMEFTCSKLRHGLNNPCNQVRSHNIQGAWFSTKPPWWTVHTSVTHKLCRECSRVGRCGRRMCSTFISIMQNSDNSTSPALKPTCTQFGGVREKVIKLFSL